MSAIGAIISGWQVEVAALQTIELWLATYLSSLERAVFNATAAILPRPDSPALQLPADDGTHNVNPASIHGGVDFLTSASELMPEIILTVEPQEYPVYFGSGDYTIEYLMSIACQAYGQDETLARMYASLYGSAIVALIVQNGDLNGVATRTRLTTPPHTEFIDTEDEDDAQLVQSVSTFTVYVDSSVNDRAGLAEPVAGDTLTAPDPSQLPPDWPSVLIVQLGMQYVEASEAADFTSFDVATNTYTDATRVPTD